MAHKRIANAVLFFLCRALTTPPDRTPQGVTTPRYLRQTAGGVIETSPLGSAFTYGYLLRSISLHRLRRQQTTESMGLYETRVVEGLPEKISSPRWPTRTREVKYLIIRCLTSLLFIHSAGANEYSLDPSHLQS